jgi:GR25 family glycosyltransferase involved in LPS biosynthesis
MKKSETLEAAANFLSSQAIQISQKTVTVNRIYKWFVEDKLVLQDWFQREYTWSKDQQVLLIHSMLNTPELVPEIVLFLDKDGKYVVADGQQRLTTIIRFIEKQFDYVSKDLVKTTKYYGTNHMSKDFNDCIEDIQDTALRAIIISNNNLDDDKVKILQSSVFHKWNSGSNLSPAEKRGANDSHLNSIIKQIVKEMSDTEKESLSLTKNIGKNKVNEILEKLSFHYLKYQGSPLVDPTPTELDNFHADSLVETNKTKLEKLLKVFVTAVSKYQSKNKKAFSCGAAPLRDILISAAMLYKDKKIHTFENLEIFILNCMEQMNKHYVLTNKFKDYRTGNTDKMDSVINDKWYRPYFSWLGKGQNTKTNKRTAYLYQTYEDFCPSENRDTNRIFSKDTQLKTWYLQDKKCAICNEELSLQEAEADHILEHSLGGLTEESNCQMIHKECHKEKTKSFMKEKNLVVISE